MAYKEIKMPLIDVNEEKATITEILFNEADEVKAGEIIICVENTKATSDVVAPFDGYFLPLCKILDEIKSGDSIAVIFESVEELNVYKNSSSIRHEKDKLLDSVNATKKAVELAEKLGIDISLVAAKKESGVVKEKDVAAFAASNKISAQNTEKDFLTLNRERVVIIGAGNGAEVVIDILLDDPKKEIVGIVDDNVRELKNYNFPILDCKIKDFPDKYGEDFYDTVIISIGANVSSMKFRRQVFEDYVKKGVRFTNAIARSAEIRRGAELGQGNIIGSGCYIGTLTRIGNNNSISYGANIGHHNIVGDHNLIAPGVFTSGSDIIGDSCIISAGVSVVNRAKIGDNVVVPVGYAIANSLETGSVIRNKL